MFKCSDPNFIYGTQHRIQHGQRGGGGAARNMKYEGLPMAAIFFMTSFHRDRGAMAPLAPPGSAAVLVDKLSKEVDVNFSDAQ